MVTDPACSASAAAASSALPRSVPAGASLATTRHACPLAFLRVPELHLAGPHPACMLPCATAGVPLSNCLHTSAPMCCERSTSRLALQVATQPHDGCLCTHCPSAARAAIVCGWADIRNAECTAALRVSGMCGRTSAMRMWRCSGARGRGQAWRPPASRGAVRATRPVTCLQRRSCRRQGAPGAAARARGSKPRPCRPPCWVRHDITVLTSQIAVSTLRKSKSLSIAKACMPHCIHPTFCLRGAYQCSSRRRRFLVATLS